MTHPFKRYDIERQGSLYLTRYDVLGNRFTKWPHIFLHRFHRSDYEFALHDHPWAFISIVLWGGYFEVTETSIQRKWPGSILFRPASWKHRVEIRPKDRGKVWSLVFTWRKVRKWGFWCPKGWVPWREHEAREAQGVNGCE